MTEWSQSEINEVRKGTTKTFEELEKLNTKQDEALANDKAMLEAFNRIARQLEALTTEIRGLRGDLSLQLDKPCKLPGLSMGGNDGTG